MNSITDVVEGQVSSRINYLFPIKKFVQAGEYKTRNENDSKKKSSEIRSLCGTEIKRSYVDIVGNSAFKSDNKSGINKPKTLINKKRKTIPATYTKQNINVNIVMKAVESNDVMKVSEYVDIDKELVLNMKDQYGWTVMMCACCAGAKDVVKLLLKFKPDLSVTDKLGNTCISLAQSKRKKDIVELLNNYSSGSTTKSINKPVENSQNSSSNNSSFCELCKEIISDSIESHLTSMVHLFNSSRKSGIPTSYGIPESNVGFQILLKKGWDREKGLGPEGSGHKFPPKTVLKQDRTGLGAKKYTARVTHDPSLVKQERIERQKTLNKRERLRNELKNKQKERDLRRALD